MMLGSATILYSSRTHPGRSTLPSSSWSASSLTFSYRLHLHRLPRIPGPFLTPLTYLWCSYHSAKGDWHDDIFCFRMNTAPWYPFSHQKKRSIGSRNQLRGSLMTYDPQIHEVPAVLSPFPSVIF